MANRVRASCEICFNGSYPSGYRVCHRHDSDHHREEILKGRGRRVSFCRSCVRVHQVEFEPDLPLQILLTSSTLAEWNAGLRSPEFGFNYGCWKSISVRGGTVGALVKAFIAEFSASSTNRPIHLVLCGGIFNSAIKGEDIFDCQLALLQLIGFINLWSVKNNGNGRSRLMVSPTFFPPMFRSNKKAQELLVGFNYLAKSINGLLGFQNPTAVTEIDKYSGPQVHHEYRFLRNWDGGLTSREAYREDEERRMLHLRGDKKFELASVLIQHFKDGVHQNSNE